MKYKLYLDTSIISHLDAPDVPEKMEDTLQLWKQIRMEKYDVVLSEIVFNELDNCFEPKRSFLNKHLQQVQYTRVRFTDDMAVLTKKFLDSKVFTPKSIADCRHIAAALLSGCDAIVSWNFKHIVNINTIKGTKVITSQEGYNDIIICSPTMLIEGGLDYE